MKNNDNRVWGERHGKVERNVSNKHFYGNNNNRKVNDNMKFKTGDIIKVDFSGNLGSEQGGVRPCVIISDTFKNQNCPVLMVAPITGFAKACADRHVFIQPEDEKPNAKGYKAIVKESTVLIEQMGKIDKCRIKGFYGRINDEKMKEIKEVIVGFLGL